MKNIENFIYKTKEFLKKKIKKVDYNILEGFKAAEIEPTGFSNEQFKMIYGIEKPRNTTNSFWYKIGYIVNKHDLF